MLLPPPNSLTSVPTEQSPEAMVAIFTLIVIISTVYVLSKIKLYILFMSVRSACTRFSDVIANHVLAKRG